MHSVFFPFYVKIYINGKGDGLMEQVRLADIKIRTFGWVQNPSDFKKLKKVVQLFDHTSEYHKILKEIRIPELVEERDGRDKFIEILNTIPLSIKYGDLVGSSFNPRSSARCNGIIQAAVEAQGQKQFIDDWSADGFLRWAHALGFVEYNYLEDAFKISQLGFDFSRAEDDSEGEREILINAVLSYPPAVRVLDLLSDGDHLTKFEIGKQLGFGGESGFTSLPQNILLQTLASTDDSTEKNKIRSDWEGSSDKYARMISNWLTKLGLVSTIRKEFDVVVGGRTQSEYISHAFKITMEGLKQLRRAKGTSKVKRITKRVHWEMFATKKLDKVYVRTRRAYILKTLESSSGMITIEKLQQKLKEFGLEEDIETIKNDINGLISIGLNIEVSSRGYSLKDTLNDFVVPVIDVTNSTKSSIEETKAEMRSLLRNIPHDYIELIEIAQDSKQNRLFEMKVMDLFINEYGFTGSHLGGSRKPDGAMYCNNSIAKYGVIVDTKAYKDGYNIPISQADEMERYVRENIDRNESVNPNKWWEIFPEKVDDFFFLFVSGFFKGRFQDQLERISINTGVKGAAISVEHLLLGAEYLKRGVINLNDIRDKFDNCEIEF